jgi:nucleoside phosphorylase
MGNIEASLLAGAGIAQSNPDLVMMVGLAGSMNPTVVHLGDVVISNQAKLYVSDKVKAFETTPKVNGTRRYRFNDQPSTGPDEIVVDRRDALMSKSFLRYERKYVESTPTDELISDMELHLRSIVEQLSRVEPNHVPMTHRDVYAARGKVKLHAGWILASQHVVDSAEYRQYLQQKNTDLSLDVHRQTGEPGRSQWKPGELLAVDMESYGLLRAVELLRTTPESQGGVRQLIGGIVVRGISDLCEEKTESDIGSGQATRKIAVRNATEVALTIIESIDYSRLLGR